MPAKVLPTPIRFFTKGVVFRKFTVAERAKIALGFGMIIETTVASQHNPGKTHPFTDLHFVSEIEAADAIHKFKAVQPERIKQQLREMQAKADAKHQQEGM